ncbi:uncharacterized protein [Drosophila virilis]|uniref:RING-type domain-containing protein n=1 Tax=Drosophila virilis TaxID=7244 RepID=B4M1L6_DROVI|nr:E3 ubiquitin-protein ligase complex slx8-rfp subunit slx8 isoform X1 [Drosophila virilis]EDW65570.2 uncharacterized protein Dvir_GJ18825 [Drosophila virilis]
MFGLFNFWNLAASSTPPSRNRRTVDSPEGNASIENSGSDENSNIVQSDNNESSALLDSNMNGSTPSSSAVSASTSDSSSAAGGRTPDSPPVLGTVRDNASNGLGRTVREHDWESLRIVSPPRIIRARLSPAPGAYPGQPVDSISLSDSSDNASPPRPRTPIPFVDLSTPEYPRRRAFFHRRSNHQERLPLAPPGPAVASTPSSSSNNSSTDDIYRCPVCFESVRDHEPASTECGHVFCHACIVAAVRATKKCPLCNEKLTLRRIFRIYF